MCPTLQPSAKKEAKKKNVDSMKEKSQQGGKVRTWQGPVKCLDI